jgi:hypothetical protein
MENLVFTIIWFVLFMTNIILSIRKGRHGFAYSILAGVSIVYFVIFLKSMIGAE